MKTNKLGILLVTYLFFLNASAFKSDTLSLDQILLKTPLINQNNPALTVSEISYDEYEIKPVNFQDAIDFSSGLWITNSENQAQDNRMAIRGFGARSAFGIRGLKIILDGIPLTTPDGQSQVDNIPFQLIENVEIMKSLSSTRYGNASGGVVSINTFSNLKDKYIVEAGYGSYGYKNIKGTYSTNSERSSTILNISQAESDGYRDHSSYLNKSLFFKHVRKFQNMNLKLNLLYFDSPYAFDPGGINMESVEENRSQARDRNVLYNSQESIKQMQTGVVLDWDTKLGQVNSNLYYSNRDFIGLLPFTNGGYVELNRDFYGAEISIKHKSKNFEWMVGTSIQDQKDHRKRFENNEGEKGIKVMDQIESFKSYGAFVLGSFNKPKYSIQAGLRYDGHEISLDENIGIDQQYIDYSKSLNALSPNLGLIFRASNKAEVYINYGQSYETPSLSELSVNPNGTGFNEELSPMISKGVDIGFRKSHKDVSYNLTAFYIDTEDEIVSYEIWGMNYYRNLGTSKRYGIELEGSYRLNKLNTFNASYTQANYEFTNQLINGQLPGVPKSNFSIEWIFNKDTFYAKLDLKYAHSLFADDMNQFKVPSFFLSNLALKNTYRIKDLDITAGFQIRNLFDEKYYDNIRLNAFGNRFYEPASLRSYIFSVSTNF
ncbi:MAG: TonB-dependent receptor [Flavobacteriaceae bacterium]|nr:TonB-dependent receptor [Flavobacteriaceae bacterium]